MEQVPEKKSSVIKILLGCAIVLVVLCGGGITIGIVAFPKLWERIQTEVAKAQEWEAFAQKWEPPTNTDDDHVFPALVDNFRRQEIDRAPAPQLGINLAGSSTTYQDGPQSVEVFAYQATKAEKDAAFKRLEATQKQQPNQWSYKIETPNNTRFSFSQGQEHGILWWSKGWLFLVRTTSQADPEAFLRSYLEAMADPPHIPEKPAQAGGEF